MKQCDLDILHRYEAIVESESIKLNTLEIFKTIDKIKRVLNKAQIPFYVTGGAAMARYGVFRFTEDADIVIYGDRQKVIDLLSIRGFQEIEDTNIVVDRQNRIRVDLLPGGEKVGPVKLNFPIPTEGDETIGLTELISLKIDCYVCNGVKRAKDLGDVVELIKANNLPKDFPVADEVKQKYEEIWDELSSN